MIGVIDKEVVRLNQAEKLTVFSETVSFSPSFSGFFSTSNV